MGSSVTTRCPSAPPGVEGSRQQEPGKDAAVPAVGWTCCKPIVLPGARGQTSPRLPPWPDHTPHKRGSPSLLPWHHLFSQHSLWSTAVGHSWSRCWSLLRCGCRDASLLRLVALGQPELQVPGMEVSTLGTAGSWAAIPSREWELPRHLQPCPPRAAPVPGELRASLHGHRWFCSSTGYGWAAFG